LGPGRLVRALQEPSGSARGEAFSAGAKNTSSTVVGLPSLTATAGFHTVCKNFETRIKPLKHMGFSSIAPDMA
jgi:hypothetical protein